MSTQNQRIRELAKATVRQIEELSATHNAQKKAIYDRFHAQVAQIKAQAGTEDLSRPGASAAPTTSSYEP